MGCLGVKTPIYGAPGRSRTHNLLIRSQALYPLSYWGVTAIIHDLTDVLLMETVLKEGVSNQSA